MSRKDEGFDLDKGVIIVLITAIIIVAIVLVVYGLITPAPCKGEQYIEILEVDVIEHIDDPYHHIISWTCTEAVTVHNYRDSLFSDVTDIYFRGKGTCALLKER